MISTSIASAARVYENVARCEIIRHWVDHVELYDISHTLRDLIRSLESEVEEEYWRQALGPIRRLVFAFSSTPMPFDRVTKVSCIDWDKLDRQIRKCEQLYPDSYAVLSSLAQKVKFLCREASSPFFLPLESLGGEGGRMSVIIRNQRMNKAVAAYFANYRRLRKAKVVSAMQLREAPTFDVLVAIGPCGWFPNYVFSAPHAQHIHVISFRWIHDLWKPSPVFLHDAESGNKSHKHWIGTLPQIISQPALPKPGLPNVQPQDLLPPALSLKATRSYGTKSQPDEEMVPAKICLLSGGRAVFVSADEKASQLVIDLSQTGSSIVRRQRTDALEPDLFLLLRTSGGGDFIAPLADRILGNLAKKRRTQQVEWKNQLIASAQTRFGALSHRDLSVRIANDLRIHSFPKVSPINIHYWMSSRSIHPLKKEDFAAILAFAGMADRTQELWAAMGEILRAHKKAGQIIRKMLLHQIAFVSLEPLERDGEMDFDLGEQDGGTLSAFQIIRISDEEFEIPVNRIGVLLDWEE